jgi:hypothetical protein
MKSRELPERSTQGIVGTPFRADFDTVVGRAVQRRVREDVREANIEAQAKARKEAVLAREDRKRKAAVYARDRRASGHTPELSKRERRSKRTAERVAKRDG